MTPAVFSVLADQNRLRIIELLGAKEQAVNDLVARMPIHQSGVSRHLGILEQAGFVQMRALGTKRMYSLRPDRFAEMERWLAQYRMLWEGRLDALGDALKRRKGNR